MQSIQYSGFIWMYIYIGLLISKILLQNKGILYIITTGTHHKISFYDDHTLRINLVPVPEWYNLVSETVTCIRHLHHFMDIITRILFVIYIILQKHILSLHLLERKP